MALATTNQRFVSYPAIFDSVTINHIRSVKPSHGIKKMMITPGGAVTTAAIAEAMREPTCELASGDLAGVLAGVSPIDGLAISTLATIQYQQRANGGTWATGSNHATLTAPKGFLYIEEISARQDAEEGAEVKLKFHGLRNGSNNPFTVLVGQALTGSVAYNSLYRLGAVTYEGSTLRGVQSVVFKSGIECGVKRDGGALCADVCSILKQNPSIEISGTDLSIAAAINGILAITDGLSIVFQSIFDSNNVTITIPAGSYQLESIDQTGNADAESKIIIDLANSAGSSPLTYSIG